RKRAPIVRGARSSRILSLKRNRLAHCSSVCKNPNTMRVVIMISSVLVCLLLAGSSSYTQTKTPDLIIVNAKIYTLDFRVSTAEGVAIPGGKFTPVRTTAQIIKVSGPSTRNLEDG